MSAPDLTLAERVLREACGPRCRTRFPLAPLTTFRIGGPAAIYLEPDSDTDLEAASHAIREAGIPFLVLGKGSNVLVSDDGFPGLVIRLGKGYRWAARDGDVLTAGGAMTLPALAGVALRHALSGMEFAAAIPASVGGAVRMNAGAHGHEMAEIVETIDVHRLSTGASEALTAPEAGFGYRNSGLPADAVVTGTTVRLERGDPVAIRAAMDEAREWRRRTQPLAEPNCGSVFTNPSGDHAARLIDAAGLKGLAVGGAHVSQKHANFIVADAGARAADVATLIELIQRRVKERSGVDLEPEIRFAGVFGG